ncbi:MAG: M48 family metalloprotease [Opitutaceae bacterium]
MANLEPTLRVLPYQEALAAYLKSEEPETWNWFSSADAQADYAESLRVDLLKQTYRLDPETHPDLAAAVTDAKAKLGLDVPVTLYQAQSNRELNAALYFLPGEAHIVLQGDVLQLLNPAELRGVIGHELAHYLLWSGSDARFLLADRIAQATANDPRAEPSQVESARLMRLYTEIYADRGALQVTGDPHSVVSGLVKIHTGIREVDAASYLRQAAEIFARGKIRTEGLSHPEAFIRARAIMLWSESAIGVDAEIARMIEGDAAVEKLDLLGQQHLTDLTRRWLRLFLKPSWFRTDAVRGQARLFFPDFEFAPEAHTDPGLLEELRDAGTSIRDYFCYLLLDFCAVDPELELEPVRAAFLLVGEVGWTDRWESLVAKELKIKKSEVQKMRAEVEAATNAIASVEPGETTEAGRTQ